MIALACLALALGVALGFLLAQLRATRRLGELSVELGRAQVQLATHAREEAERASAAGDLEARMRNAFDSLAADSLRNNSELFLRMARETLGRDQVVAQGALKERELAIAQLVEPLRVALERTEAQVQSLERDRRDAFASLRTQIETLNSGQAQLQRETRNLVTALRRPEVRGRWGELTLRRVVELAGMAEHCDFTEQLHLFLGGRHAATRSRGAHARCA